MDGIENARKAETELEADAERLTRDDPNMKALADEEVQRCEKRLPQLELAVKLSLLPKDADDET